MFLRNTGYWHNCGSMNGGILPETDNTWWKESRLANHIENPFGMVRLLVILAIRVTRDSGSFPPFIEQWLRQ